MCIYIFNVLCTQYTTYYATFVLLSLLKLVIVESFAQSDLLIKLSVVKKHKYGFDFKSTQKYTSTNISYQTQILANKCKHTSNCK